MRCIMSKLNMLIPTFFCLANFTVLAAVDSIENSCSRSRFLTPAEALKKQAELEFENDENKDVILEYINMILEDGILKDPRLYLNEWQISRGWTREYRIPEDAAFNFFNRYLS